MIISHQQPCSGRKAGLLHCISADTPSTTLPRRQVDVLNSGQSSSQKISSYRDAAVCKHLWQHRKTRRQANLLVQAIPESFSDAQSIEAAELPRIAVFVSGGGSNFKAIHAAILDGGIKAHVAVSERVPSLFS